MAETKIPLTRPVSLTIHESMMEPLRKMAEDRTEGSVSEMIRLCIYAELLNKGYISKQDIRRLG